MIIIIRQSKSALEYNERHLSSILMKIILQHELIFLSTPPRLQFSVFYNM